MLFLARLFEENFSMHIKRFSLLPDQKSSLGKMILKHKLWLICSVYNAMISQFLYGDPPPLSKP
jgi:hypothetical protein